MKTQLAGMKNIDVKLINIRLTKSQAMTLVKSLKTTGNSKLLSAVEKMIHTSEMTPVQRNLAARNEQIALGLCVWGRCPNVATEGETKKRYCLKHRRRYQELTFQDSG